ALLNRGGHAARLAAPAGATPQGLQTGAQQAQAEEAGQQAGDPKAAEESVLEQFAYELTAEARAGRLDPVIGRADEIDQTIEILARRTKNNPVLIGEAGVGQTALLDGLAEAIGADQVPAPL